MSLLGGQYEGRGRGSVWFVVLAIAAAALLPIGYLAMEKSGPKFVLTGSGIQLLDAIYLRTIPYSALRVEGASVRTLNTGELAGLSRVDGVYGLDYCAGWFRTAAGRRVFLLSTNCRSGAEVASIPTTEDYDLILGGTDASATLSRIRAKLPPQ